MEERVEECNTRVKEISKKIIVIIQQKKIMIAGSWEAIGKSHRNDKFDRYLGNINQW